MCLFQLRRLVSMPWKGWTRWKRSCPFFTNQQSRSHRNTEPSIVTGTFIQQLELTLDQQGLFVSEKSPAVTHHSETTLFNNWEIHGDPCSRNFKNSTSHKSLSQVNAICNFRHSVCLFWINWKNKLVAHHIEQSQLSKHLQACLFFNQPHEHRHQLVSLHNSQAEYH